MFFIKLKNEKIKIIMNSYENFIFSFFHFFIFRFSFFLINILFIKLK